MFGKITAFVRACVPSNLMRRLDRRRIRRQYGVFIAGSTEPIEIIQSAFGKNCRISAPVYISGSRFGDYSYVEPYTRICSSDIGKFCSVAPYCVIGPPSHPLDRVSTHPAFFLRNPSLAYSFVIEPKLESKELRTTIGNDVWIGAGAFVRRGVVIGTGAVIGAGAVVVKDVPPYAIVGGVPATLIKYRFDQETIAQLLASRWWERDDAWLRQNAAAFADVAKFLAAR